MCDVWRSSVFGSAIGIHGMGLVKRKDGLPGMGDVRVIKQGSPERRLLYRPPMIQELAGNFMIKRQRKARAPEESPGF